MTLFIKKYFLNSDPQNGLQDLKVSRCIIKVIRNVQVFKRHSSLLTAQVGTKLSAKSHFATFWSLT